MVETIFVSVLATILLTNGLPAKAQQLKKVPRIAYLTAASPSAMATWTEAFRDGLRDLGYVEGKNIVIEWRSAEGKSAGLPGLAAELVRLNVAVIVTGGSTSTGAVKEATGTIPIVMTMDTDPVGSGFVANLARPGGNITGLSTQSPEISGKRLELLKDIRPHLSRVTFGISVRAGNAQSLKETELAAGAFGVQIQDVDILGPKDIETAFRGATKGRTDAILLLASPVLHSHRTQVAKLAAQNRLPAIYPWLEFVEEGGLMSYGVSFTDLYRRAAMYVDKILRGAKPADLPVEQPTKFELVINLKTAKQIGLPIPPHVLARADRVIK